MEAAAALDLPNPTRTWQSSKVQKCLADFGSPVSPEVDYAERLEAIRPTDTPKTTPLEPIQLTLLKRLTL